MEFFFFRLTVNVCDYHLIPTHYMLKLFENYLQMHSPSVTDISD
jgi:hypothetical protein